MKNPYKLYLVIILICIVYAYGYMTYVAHAPAETADQVQKQQQSYIEKKTITLNFVGDILAARAVELTMRKKGYDYPFAHVTDMLSDADITFANLETPLIGTATSGKTTIGGTTVFRGDVAFADAIQRAGIDIVSLANNHMKDQGEKGIISTLETLHKAGIQHVGAGKHLDEARQLQIIEKQGVRVGYLAYNDADVVPDTYHATDIQSGTNIMNTSQLREDVTIARTQVDVLVVSMHSGTEYITDHPNVKQTTFAHAAIDAGADMVIGHHPHVLQPLEIYNGKYIFYSLGNFVFDQPWPDTKESALLRMSVTLSRSNTGKEKEDMSSNQRYHIDTYTPHITPLTIQNFQPKEVEDTNQKKHILGRFTKNLGMLSIAGKNIFVEIASTTESRVTGLSYRKNMPKETGLLFIFDTMDKPGIWMKDMKFPIDIYWFDNNFKLVDTRYSVVPETYPDVFYPKTKAMYVLETQTRLISPVSLTENLTAQLTYIQ
jgi:poly-gamma-glutamate capsule biosynthesis protein CapA/YwtB (metallophosphatase superfamily)/uncharacterized membrane protein (UPF0127 family)